MSDLEERLDKLGHLYLLAFGIETLLASYLIFLPLLFSKYLFGNHQQVSHWRCGDNGGQKILLFPLLLCGARDHTHGLVQARLVLCH